MTRTPKTFALALLDVVAPASTAGAPLDFNGLREAVAKLPDRRSEIRHGLLTLIDASDGSIASARENIAQWFDDSMDRISGWYKRRSQWILFGISALVVAFLNADTVTLTTELWHNTALRQAVVAAAESYPPKDLPATPELGETLNQLNALALPLGWTAADLSEGPLQVLGKVWGLFITALGVSLGAPFWFDLLNRFISLRGAGKVPPTAEERRKTEKAASAENA